MKPSACLSVPDTAICCRVAAHATLRVRADELASLRREPGPQARNLLSPSFLKHAEEQSVAGIAVVLRAMAAAGWALDACADWGVVAAANFFGRSGTAQAAQRYVQEGAWGISPHLIPHQSLHAVSGTISQALKINGPNFGVGGGPDSGPDAFLVAPSLLVEGRLPGLWLVLTGHEHEAIPAPAGQFAARPPALEAVAFALQEATAGDSLSLRVGVGDSAELLPEFTLGGLIAELTQRETPPAGRWSLGSFGWVELEALGRAERPS